MASVKINSTIISIIEVNTALSSDLLGLCKKGQYCIAIILLLILITIAKTHLCLFDVISLCYVD